MAFVILIGTSGSGKTAIAGTIASHFRDAQVYHFDHIGVPSTQQMLAEYGSGEAWQRAKTLEWITKLASVVTATMTMPARFWKCSLQLCVVLLCETTRRK
jgi:adenylate kinase family enzyme